MYYFRESVSVSSVSASRLKDNTVFLEVFRSAMLIGDFTSISNVLHTEDSLLPTVETIAQTVTH